MKSLGKLIVMCCSWRKKELGSQASIDLENTELKGYEDQLMEEPDKEHLPENELSPPEELVTFAKKEVHSNDNNLPDIPEETPEDLNHILKASPPSIHLIGPENNYQPITLYEFTRKKTKKSSKKSRKEKKPKKKKHSSKIE